MTIRREVDRFLREQQAAVDVVLEFDSIENIKKAVEIGAGVALLPEPTIRPEVASRALVARPLFGCRMVRPLGIIHRGEARLSPGARAFLDLLCSNQGNGQTQPATHAGNGNGQPRKAGGQGKAARKKQGN